MARRLRTKNWKENGRNLLLCTSMQPSTTNVLRKTTRSLSQHVTYSDLDLNLGPPEYEVASTKLCWILYGLYYYVLLIRHILSYNCSFYTPTDGFWTVQVLQPWMGMGSLNWNCMEWSYMKELSEAVKLSVPSPSIELGTFRILNKNAY
jgi:hypothetical protein